MREKVEIVQGGCRPVEEQRAALEILLEEAEDGKDRELIQTLIRMNDWCLEELRREYPGQIFLFLERGFRRMDELHWSSTGNVAGVFYTYNEFTAALDNFAAEYEIAEDPTRVECVASAEKWVMVDGKMDTALEMSLYVGGGRLFIQKIWSWDTDHTWKDRLGHIPWETDKLFGGHLCRAADRLPLPFRNGDLVRVNIPDLDEPIYGVLNVAQLEKDRYSYLLYYRGSLPSQAQHELSTDQRIPRLAGDRLDPSRCPGGTARRTGDPGRAEGLSASAGGDGQKKPPGSCTFGFPKRFRCTNRGPQRWKNY